MPNVIPESGKPADLSLDNIENLADANRVVAWLSDVLLDMDRQIKEKPHLGPEDEWVRKIQYAKSRATLTLHRAIEKRDAFAGIDPFLTNLPTAIANVLDITTIEKIDKELIKLGVPGRQLTKLAGVKT